MRVEKREKGQLFRQFDYLDLVDSTNDYLKAFVEDGEPLMVVAREQTAGKGRFDRKWYSPPEEGLYVSYLLYPGWRVEHSPFLNILSGLAVVRTIQEESVSDLQLKLKLPNDILLEGKKVGGILTETSSLHDQILWAIVGIGVNLYQRSFPKDLGQKATSLSLEGVTVGHRLDFCDSLTRQFELLYRQLETGAWEVVQAEFEAQLTALDP